MKKTVFFFLFMMILFLCYSKTNALMIGLSTKQLVNDAELIVVGKVSNIESYWNGEETIILSRAHIEVNDILKGKCFNSIHIEYRGGIVGNIEMRESDSVSFTEGEEVVLFLKQKEPSKNHLQRVLDKKNVFNVVGRAQGKYTITDDGFAYKSGFTVTDETEVLVQRSIDYISFIDMIRGMVNEK